MASAARKHLRYFVTQPASDRRLEQRFSSHEDVVMRLPEWGTVRPAVASDIGRMGLRLESLDEPGVGEHIEIVFPGTSDHVRCFGRVVWARRKPNTRSFEAGVSVEAWYGIVLGENSWLRFKGAIPSRERRSNPR